MPRRVGKEVAQQVEITLVSQRHSEDENSLKHLPPISPLADCSYGNPIYRKDDEEKVDFAEVINENSRAIREKVAESCKTFIAVSERTIEHVLQQQNVPRQPVPPTMELPQQNLLDLLPGGHGGHVNQPHVVQQMPNAQNNGLGAVQVQFNRQQQNNPAGGILRPQDLVKATFRATESLNANQQRYVPLAWRPNATPQPNLQNNAFQPLKLQATPPPLDRNHLIDLVQKTYGPALRPVVRRSYHKAYLDYIDRDNPFPRGFKVPEFTLFSRDVI
ncbi:hypothetical protein SLEP1_g51204 [Rubroshorea leprosula]|uniref:Uncharacterized protein n=1 Tax=Rubroshorea leprosula TaxID=152421 RepID=A0AAV5M2J0_9ROSI|nr:hypothetical protein SLEP1_g51204 [Rubroshorea leprosula]